MKTVRMLVILVLVLVGLVGIEAQGVEVYPTGNPAQDVPNIQNAVDLGGNVLLKATDTDGNPQYFNFGDFGIVGIEKDVVIMGESISETTYPTLPDGRTISSDRAVIYGGGNPDAPGRENIRGTLNVYQGSFEISNIRLDSSRYAGIFVLNCDGVAKPCRIRDNVITYTKPYADTSGWRMYAKSIAIVEGGTLLDGQPIGDIYGRLYIEDNRIEYNPNLGWISNVEAISVVHIYTSAAKIYIKGNEIKLHNQPSSMAKGIGTWDVYAELTIENNVIDAGTNNASEITGMRLALTDNALVSGNIISGQMYSGIYLLASHNVLVEGNAIEHFRPIWSGIPILLEMSQNCTVTENELIDVCDFNAGYVPYAGITISGYFAPWIPGGVQSNNNTLMRNDYTLSRLPGLTAQSDGPFCVILEEGTNDNFVDEQGGFPTGTNAKRQVFDGGCYDDYGTWTTTNRVIGHSANELAQQEDLNPGIGQRLKAIRDASGELEE